MKFIQKNGEIYLNKKTLKNLFNKYTYHVNVYPYDDIPDEGGVITIEKNVHIGNNVYLEFEFEIPYENKYGKIIPTRNLSIDYPDGYVFYYNKNFNSSYREINLFGFDNSRIHPQEFFDMSNDDLHWKLKNKQV